MRYLGKDGFVRIARQLLDATDRLLEGLRQINGVAPVCQPDLPIVAWQTPGLSVQSVANEMRKQGWFIRTMASPEAVHMGMLSLHQVPVVDEYLASVRRSVQALQPGHMGEG